MTADTLIRAVRPLGEDLIDLRIVDGLIQEVGADLTSSTGTPVIDGAGRLVFPGFVDAHTHIDKTLMGMGWHRHDVGPRLLDLIENERRVRREEGIDAHRQSTRHARAAIATGTTAIRTHVDIDTEIGLAGFHGVQRTKHDLREAIDIQIVAFPQSGMLVHPGTAELLEEALREGADVIGGLDPSTIDRDPVRHLDTVFGLAERYDVDVDIHLHEPGTLGAFAIELIAERTIALGWQGRVVISHAFALGHLEDAEWGRLVDLVNTAGITIMTHGPGGHRLIPNIARLLAAGVRLCTGNDGVRDSWSPLNTADMLERIYILAYRNGLRRDDDIEHLIRIATDGGRAAMRHAPIAIAPGSPADLVLVEGETHVEAVISRPRDRTVLKAGRLVADGGTCLV